MKHFTINVDESVINHGSFFLITIFRATSFIVHIKIMILYKQ